MIAVLMLALQIPNPDWPAYGNDPGGMRFSPLTQITKDNAAHLRQAWSYRHGDMAIVDGQPKTSFECTPIENDGTLYFSTPFSRVIALNAATGVEKWTFDPKIIRKKPIANEPLVHRGVALWQDAATGKRRVFVGTYDARLYALDAANGLPCEDFGSKGFLDLKKGLRKVDFMTYQCTQPPAVIGDAVIVGSTIGDNNAADAGDGSIRAFDARTGAQLWSFNPAHEGSGAANAWAVISTDPATNTVFVPTSSPSPDYYGGLRKQEGYGNSLVALDAKTGTVKWSYQVVHHDVWDYDIPAQPILCTAKGVPAVAVLTKMGMIFVLDRKTGKPIFPVKERRIAGSTVPGEDLSSTEPMPTLPPPLVPHKVEIWGRNAEETLVAKTAAKGLGGGSLFFPPALQETMEYPSTIGGCNWSGGSFDPDTQTLYTNVNNLVTKVILMPIEKLDDYKKDHFGVDTNRMKGTPYAMSRGVVYTKEQLPACKPPWGKLCAVNLSSGKVRWAVPLGVMPQVKLVEGSDKWGSISLGGCITTKTGLVFIAGACDGVFRAFDSATGKVLWEQELPAGGNATPMTYSAGGKQYLVICAGGHSGLHTKIGDYVVAYALP